VIDRGDGMEKRSMADAHQVKQAQDSYIRDVAGKSPAQQITEAKALLDSGAISDAEFQAIKTKTLA
jgi:hypothetical protein